MDRPQKMDENLVTDVFYDCAKEPQTLKERFLDWFEYEVHNRHKFFKRSVKHFFQRRIRGWDDSDTYCLKYTNAKFLLPRLKRFRELAICYPADLEGMEQWHEILDEIIWSFEALIEETEGTKRGMAMFHGDDEKENLTNWERVEKGIGLYGEYFFDLWW